MVSFSKFPRYDTGTLFKFDEPLSKQFKVFLNGEEIPVYTCRISKYPFNTVWPNHQRSIDQTDIASFVNIVSDEAFTLEVVPLMQYKKPLIKPYSKNIKLNDDNGRISFTLNESGQFAFECDSYHNLLYIFNSKPIPAPAKEDVTYYFGAGIHFAHKITLKSHESVYVDKDALVYGCFYAENAEDIRIFGNGIIDNGNEERVARNCYENLTNGNLKFYDCKNIRIEGIGMKNSAIWCLNLFGCFDVTADNIKIFGQWRYNTDGIDIVNCQNIFINNSFIHSFDDTITIKGIDKYCHIDNKNIHTKNCVLWCDWGKCCEVGIETTCREYSNISFKDCDIIKTNGRALDINNGDCAEISDVVFENINVEYNSCDTEPVYQENDDMVYGCENTVFIPELLVINNLPFRTPECKKLWGMPDRPDNLSFEGVEPRAIHGITVKNIHVYYDEALPLENSKPIIKGTVYGVEECPALYDISISGIYINGEKLDPQDLDFKFTNSDVTVD